MASRWALGALISLVGALGTLMHTVTLMYTAAHKSCRWDSARLKASRRARLEFCLVADVDAERS
jgi:hypothetical protein